MVTIPPESHRIGFFVHVPDKPSEDQFLGSEILISCDEMRRALTVFGLAIGRIYAASKSPIAAYCVDAYCHVLKRTIGRSYWRWNEYSHQYTLDGDPLCVARSIATAYGIPWHASPQCA